MLDKNWTAERVAAAYIDAVERGFETSLTISDSLDKDVTPDDLVGAVRRGVYARVTIGVSTYTFNRGAEFADVSETGDPRD
jgi:hypothetical protein